MQKADILDRLKVIIPKNEDNSTTYDAIVGYTVDKVLQDIRNYTHIPDNEELPNGLLFVAVGMCNTLIKTTGMLNPQEDTLGVSSITEGDESISYRAIGDDISKIAASNPISQDYRIQLNGYRRLDWS